VTNAAMPVPLISWGTPDDGGLDDRRVGDERALDLHGAEAVPETLMTSSTRPMIQK
jgi:hypothetical protein